MSAFILPTSTVPASVVQSLTEVLADVLGAEQVSPDAHFFDDLGADSMLMARFCARVRKRADLPSVSMKDVYQHPTIRSLAAALSHRPPNALEAALAEVLAEVVGIEQVSLDATSSTTWAPTRCSWPASALGSANAPTCRRSRSRTSTATRRSGASRRRSPRPTPPTEVVPSVTQPTPTARASTREFVACGVLQLLLFLGYSYLAADLRAGLPVDLRQREPDRWLPAIGRGRHRRLLHRVDPADPAKWVLVGRWKPQQIRVWSLAYVRFWLVKTLVAANPLVLFAGRRSTRCICGRWARRSAAAS